ncbi:39S ribosomal protein L44, mitochondrial [Halocaridina rubra]|uniref:Large ribosomal subunit protein mL44 n=1 Tax=Halocaridina rubra TaxID=373956 RepID=A0AAN8X6C0_HALRR
MSLPKAFQLLRFTTYVAPRRLISATACTYGIKSRWQMPYRVTLKNRMKEMEKKGLLPTNARSDFIEWNYDSEIYAFGKRLHEEFDESLLRQALIDPSYITRETLRQQELGVEVPALQMSGNSELSTEGKDIIFDYATKFVRATHRVLPEEGVSALVDYLTSEELLSEIGHGIGLKDLILTEEYPPSQVTVVNAFQSVVAVLNRSSGLSRCHIFVKDFVLTQLVGKNIYDIWKIEDPVSILSNILLQNGREAFEPRLVFQSGKNTIQAVYQVAVYCEKQFMGTGMKWYGETVNAAVEQAAWDALSRLFQTTEAVSPIPFEKPEQLNLNDNKNMPIDNWSIDRASNIVMC